jgi:hypothetical protein
MTRWQKIKCFLGFHVHCRYREVNRIFNYYILTCFWCEKKYTKKIKEEKNG